MTTTEDPTSNGDSEGGGGGSSGDATPPQADNRPPSPLPPGGLDPEQVPMFVSIGWDDNADVGGMLWSLGLTEGRTNPAGTGQASTYDGAPMTMTYYNTGVYTTGSGATWKQAYDAGHEIGNHTQSHGQHLQRLEDIDVWNGEIEDCQSQLEGLDIPLNEVYGFRTPFLGTADATIQAVADAGFLYDCSLEEGYQPSQDGTNYLWPYTLDEGSPGNDQLVEWGGLKNDILPKPGLWEMPVYAFIVPPDEVCKQYGVEPGFRDRMKEAADYFDTAGGKITGFDYNVWYEFGMTPAEVAATWMYTLDLRLQGNRAPFLLGTHTDEYDQANAQRREAMEIFLDYALEKPDVRIVSVKQALDWIREPTPLG
ncbi:MAG: polysaccharide deacetylase family protein [Myxococcota bacterium]